MGWVQLLVTFAVTWWLVLFMTLPFGAQPDERPQPGTVESAPARPRLLIKALITTVLAIVITALIAWIVETGLVDFRPGNAGG
jgi:predicted secreted protein